MGATKQELQQMIEVVTLAIPREMDTYQFYANAAERSTGQESRNLFESLAQQEKVHEALLRDLLEDLQNQIKALAA